MGGDGIPANGRVILKITTLFFCSAASLPVGSLIATSMLVNAELLVGSVQIYRPALWYFRPFLARHEGGHLSAQTLRIRAYRRSLHCLAFPVEAKDVKQISPHYYFMNLYFCDSSYDVIDDVITHVGGCDRKVLPIPTHSM